jgi:hypothetical protein
MKLYSFPQVECIGKGKASAPYEFDRALAILERTGQFR